MNSWKRFTHKDLLPSFVDATSDGNNLPIALDSSFNFVSRALSRSTLPSLVRDWSDRDICICRLSVGSLVAGFESISSDSVLQLPPTMELKQALAPFRNSRSGYKAWVTHSIGQLTALQQANTLDYNVFKCIENSVNNHVQHIEDHDVEISAA